MRRIRIVLPALLSTVLSLPSPARAQVATPERWQWIGAGGALVGSLLLDREVREELFVEADGEAWGTARATSRLSQPEVLVPVLALAYGAGRLLDHPELERASERAAVALALSALAGGVVKIVVGRARPDALPAPDADELRPFSVAGAHQSFPSGHTAAAFAVATALAGEIDSPLVRSLAFAPAAVVGWSRLYSNMHWSSDVVAGAILGIASARLARRWLPEGAERLSVSPILSTHAVGLHIGLPSRRAARTP